MSAIISKTTFINKYKPYSIDDFNFDEKLKLVLRTLIEIDNLNILFIGNQSSGKTTLLYSLIREYYGFKKEDNIPETNIMFINNLKEQGINFYRNDMKSFCQSHCTIFGKKKMVIIDDIDNINEQSQQVFRNYIDKYSNNVNFISVCTNIQKVIESIQSRLNIIKIKPPDRSQFELITKKIIKNENIVIDKASIDYLLNMSQNSIRFIINMLEKIYILGQPVDIELCKQICSNISFQLFENYVIKVKKRELVDAIKILFDIHEYGYSVIDILDYFFIFVKNTEILSEDEKYKIIPLLCKYITVFHNIHEDVIELAFFTNQILDCIDEKM
jgi:DNA polymerase III delta prime subunit